MVTTLKFPIRFAARGLATIAAVTAIAMCAPGRAGADTLDALYDAAKAEGKVTVYGPPNAVVRKELTAAFAKRFPGMQLEYTGMQGNSAAAKIRSETRAGVYSVDAVISGSSTGLRLLKPAKAIGPLEPLITVPDAKNQANWKGGEFTWADKDHMVLVMLGQTVAVAFINTNLVKPGEVTSDKDLLNPKWKGKIASHNPLFPGPAGVGYLRFYNLHGPEYVRALAAQDILLSRDLRQLADWVAKGRYAIGIGLSSTIVSILVKNGVKTIRPLTSREWKDPQLFSQGFGALMVPSKVAHPASSKLFINWILTKEGQTVLATANGTASMRADVPSDHVPADLKLYDDIKYIPSHDEAWEFHPNQKKLRQLLTEVGFQK